jgi:hypothetical protein
LRGGARPPLKQGAVVARASPLSRGWWFLGKFNKRCDQNEFP